MNKTFNTVFFLLFASIATANQALANTVTTDPAKPQGEPVVTSGPDDIVKVYRLPERYKQILLTQDNNIYAIESNPSAIDDDNGVSCRDLVVTVKNKSSGSSSFLPNISLLFSVLCMIAVSLLRGQKE